MRARHVIIAGLLLAMPALAQPTQPPAAAPAPAAPSAQQPPAAPTTAPQTAAQPAVTGSATEREHSDKIACDQIPLAQKFLDGLKPGPNTKRAQDYLDRAKTAPNDTQCVADLRKVDYYARRSAAADQRLARAAQHRAAPGAEAGTAQHRVLYRRERCADIFHQDRPGGSDYRGPPVAGCRPVW